MAMLSSVACAAAAWWLCSPRRGACSGADVRGGHAGASGQRLRAQGALARAAGAQPHRRRRPDTGFVLYAVFFGFPPIPPPWLVLSLLPPSPRAPPNHRRLLVVRHKQSAHGCQMGVHLEGPSTCSVGGCLGCVPEPAYTAEHGASISVCAQLQDVPVASETVPAVSESARVAQVPSVVPHACACARSGRA